MPHRHAQKRNNPFPLFSSGSLKGFGDRLGTFGDFGGDFGGLRDPIEKLSLAVFWPPGRAGRGPTSLEAAGREETKFWKYLLSWGFGSYRIQTSPLTVTQYKAIWLQ